MVLGLGAQEEISEDLRYFLSIVAPPMWQRMMIRYSAVGGYAEYTTSVMFADGSTTVAWDPGDSFLVIMNVFRDLGAIAGRGSWYSCELVYNYHSSWGMVVDAAGEPDWIEPPLPEDYRAELERFDVEPGEMPRWLARKAGATVPLSPLPFELPQGVPTAGGSAEAGLVVVPESDPDGVPVPARASAPAGPMRRAKIFDGLSEDGHPTVNRAPLEADEIQRIAVYLESGPRVPLERLYLKDVYQPHRVTVPRTVQTDGTWVWTGEVRYYLEEYGLPPEGDFVAHVRANGYTVPAVTKEAIAGATAAQVRGGTA